MVRPEPPQDVLREVFAYNKRTGIFVWKKNPKKGRARIGLIAGTVTKLGYRRIGLAGYGQIMAARLAWVYVFGPIPVGMEIDHKNGKPDDNRLRNLRLATSSQQKMNRGCQSNNKARLRGAYYHACRRGKKWRTQIKTADGLIFLGYFHTAEEASAAHNRAAKKYFGAFYSPRTRREESAASQ